MSSSYKPGDIVYTEFTTQVFSTGVATNADSTPTGTVNRNGTDDGAVTVTVTNIDTGRYKAVFTIPTTYVPGDVLNLTIAATVSTIAGKVAIWNNKIGVGLISKGTATAGGSSTITLQTALGADSLAVGSLIVITSGTGAGQVRIISAYVNSTQVVTVNRAWVTNPDSTSVYAILPSDSPTVDANGRVDVIKIAGTSQTARDIGANVLLSNGTGTGQLDFTSGVVKANVTQILGTAVSTPATAGVLDVNVKNINNISASSVTTISAVLGTASANTPQTGDAYAVVNTRLPSALTGGNINACLQDIDLTMLSTLTSTIVSAVWRDTTPGDFTQAGSIGKSLFTSGIVPGSAGGHSIAGNNAATTYDTLTVSGITTFTGNVVASGLWPLDTRVPAALVGGRMDSNMSAIDGSSSAATKQKKAALVIYEGTVTGAATNTTLIDSGLTQSANDFWNGRVIIFLTGALMYQATNIEDFDASTDKLTFAGLTTAPSAADTYIIV